MNKRPRKRTRPYSPEGWTLEERLAFHSRRDPLSGCRIWHGASKGSGYGVLNFAGRPQRVHRLAWQSANGPIPPGMDICHRCDERGCINPDHLFLGTRADNMRHLKAKRMVRSDARAAALTDASATIRIIYRGVELVGEVRVAAVDPRVKKVEDDAAARRSGAPVLDP